MKKIKNKKKILPKNKNQEICIKNIIENDINFIIGPAGTGKTLIAISSAINFLEEFKINKIILVKPILEVDEKLGYLPGNILQKVDPYFKPLYDTLNYLIEAKKVQKLIENNIIEIYPLAYMRGRNIKNSFIILDEGQNTTIKQMKMFLTRISTNSKMVITGDISQIDLNKNKISGLKHAMSILKEIPGIKFSFLETKDIIRHKLITNIIDAYEKNKQ